MNSVAAAWDHLAETYDDRRHRDPIYVACCRAAARALAPQQGDRVLEAGAGTGMVTQLYDRAGIEVRAVDVSPASLGVLCRRHFRADVRAVEADITHLPFADGVFDRVVCANTIQHLDAAGRDRAVAELARVTRSQGRVVVTVHNFSRSKQRTGWIKEGKPGQEGIPYNYRFQREDLHDLLRRWLIVERIAGVGLPLPYRWKLGSLSRLAEAIAQRFSKSADHAHMLLAVCRAP